MQRLEKAIRGAVLPGLMVCAVWAGAAEFDGARRVFDREWRDIDEEYDKGCRVALERYQEDLQKVLRYMDAKGDEYGARPTKAEIDRFNRDRNVPAESPPGTPELIKKARSRHLEAVAPMNALRTEKREALVDKYVTHLTKLEARLAAESRGEDVRAVRGEIERASSKLGEDGGIRPRSILLPKLYARSLSLVYIMSSVQGKRIPDQSGRRRHGQLIGTRPVSGQPGALSFTEYQDVLEFNPIRLGSQWTMVVEAMFPLTGGGKQRVLASGGFRQDHVAVDGNGILGVGPGAFAGSGYSVGKLKGWHRLVVVARSSQTLFFVDGRLVGSAPAVCKDPLAAIGNSTASGYPWGGGLRAILLWTRALAKEEIVGLPARLVSE